MWISINIVTILKEPIIINNLIKSLIKTLWKITFVQQIKI